MFVTLKEEEQAARSGSDGTFGGERYFTCPLGRGFFTLLEYCRQDSRFDSNTPTTDARKERGELFRRCSCGVHVLLMNEELNVI